MGTETRRREPRMTRIFGLTALLLLVFVSGLRAQQTRADLIDTALDTADDDIRVGLLIRALDPELGPPDSLWAVGAFSIAFRLTETGREPQARTWLRWAAREGAGLGLSPRDFPALFPPPLATAWDQAVAAVEGDGEEVRVATEYDWPSAFVPGSPGVLIVEVSGAEPGTVAEIEGVGTVSLGVRRALEPGTYDVVLTRPDGDVTRIRREVLPGIDRTLTVLFGDPLAPAARSRAEASLVRLRRGSGSGAVCSNGVVVGTAGWVVAPLDILDGGGLEAVTSDGRVLGGLDIALRDAELGIGVGRVGDTGVPVMETSASRAGESTWALFHDGCGPVRLVSTTLQGGGGARVPVDAPATSAGGAIVNAEGALVALGLGATALRASEVEAAVERARRILVAARDEEGPQGSDQGGGFPVKWVAGGAAVVGLAAALLLGGGGNGDERTGVVITWPGG